MAGSGHIEAENLELRAEVDHLRRQRAGDVAEGERRERARNRGTMRGRVVSILEG